MDTPPLVPNQIPGVLKPAPIEIKTAKGGKKDKGLSKGAVIGKLKELLQNLEDLDATEASYKELGVPDKFGADVVAQIFELIVAAKGVDLVLHTFG